MVALETQGLSLVQVQIILDELNAELDEIQTVLDTQVETKTVHLNVIELKKDHFLLGTTEAGLPADADLVSVQALVPGNNQLPSFVPVDVVASPADGVEGVLNVELLLSRSLRATKVLQFVVEHDHDNGVNHHGTVLVHLKGGVDDEQNE